VGKSCRSFGYQDEQVLSRRDEKDKQLDNVTIVKYYMHKWIKSFEFALKF